MQWEILGLDEAITQLHVHLQHAQEHINSQDDKKRSERSFKVGEWDFVKLWTHHQ